MRTGFISVVESWLCFFKNYFVIISHHYGQNIIWHSILCKSVCHDAIGCWSFDMKPTRLFPRAWLLCSVVHELAKGTFQTRVMLVHWLVGSSKWKDVCRRFPFQTGFFKGCWASLICFREVPVRSQVSWGRRCVPRSLLIEAFQECSVLCFTIAK